MRPLPRSLTVLTLAFATTCVAAGEAGAQQRARSRPPSSAGSSSGSSSSSSSGQSERESRTEAQRRESTPPPATSAKPQGGPPPQAQSQGYQGNNSNNGNDRRRDNRQAVPAPRDRYIDRDRDGRNDNPAYRPNYDPRYDSRYERYDRNDYNRWDSRWSDRRNDWRYAPSYRYSDRRVVIAPRTPRHFSSPWLNFRLDFRVAGINVYVGRAVPFPGWYNPYIVGVPGYQRPYMSYGGVVFDIQPWDAELWIDGEYAGRVGDYSPYESPLALVAGRHWVDVRGRYGRSLRFQIDVVPGQVTPYRGDLGY